MAEKAEAAIPIGVTRSLLTVILPGLVAITPWLLVLAQYRPALTAMKEAPTLAHTLLFALVTVAGTICQGFGTRLESTWDKEREEEFQVSENWYAYLSRPLEHEPVAYRYISRLSTTMYFELSMLFAVPFFALGSFVLIATLFYSFYWPALAIGIVLGFAAIFFFWSEAKTTHKTICVTRREVMNRLGTYLAGGKE
jgi:hypothetical protein